MVAGFWLWRFNPERISYNTPASKLPSETAPAMVMARRLGIFPPVHFRATRNVKELSFPWEECRYYQEPAAHWHEQNPSKILVRPNRATTRGRMSTDHSLPSAGG